MAGTYSQIYLQIVFAVKGRQNLLDKSWRHEVFKYMHGISTNKKQKMFIVNGVEDHVHFLVSMNPSSPISDLVRDIKNNSTNFINKNNFIQRKFQWQEGFGVFSYGHSQIERVYNYILNQEEHHRKKKFKEEYLKMLNSFNVEYHPRYLFEWYD